MSKPKSEQRGTGQAMTSEELAAGGWPLKRLRALDLAIIRAMGLDHERDDNHTTIEETALGIPGWKVLSRGDWESVPYFAKYGAELIPLLEEAEVSVWLYMTNKDGSQRVWNAQCTQASVGIVQGPTFAIAGCLGYLRAKGKEFKG